MILWHIEGHKKGLLLWLCGTLNLKPKFPGKNKKDLSNALGLWPQNMWQRKKLWVLSEIHYSKDYISYVQPLTLVVGIHSSWFLNFFSFLFGAGFLFLCIYLARAILSRASLFQCNNDFLINVIKAIMTLWLLQRNVMSLHFHNTSIIYSKW